MENNMTLQEMGNRYKNCNLLMPIANSTQMNPFYKLTVMEVQADLKEGSGDIFKVGSSKVNGQFVDVFSPAKPLLMKLASAAGIQFDPKNTYGEYITKNCYRAKAYGAMMMPDGTGKTHCDEKVINLDDEEDRFRLEFMDKSLAGIPDKKQAEEAAKMFKGTWKDGVDKWNKPCKVYVLDDADRQKYIERGVLVNMTLLRKTFAEKAMTGAILRVVRALVGMKGTYTIEELSKPFAIPRVTFAPDYNDPMVRAEMMNRGMNSVSNMFGTTASQPMLQQAEAAPMDAFNPEDFTGNAAFASDYEEDPADDFNNPSYEPERPTERPQSAPQTNGGGCEQCGAPITAKVAEYSKKKFGAALCMNCQRGM